MRFKVFFFILFILSVTSVEGQMLHIYSYEYGNGAITLKLCSNNLYSLSSINPEWLNQPDDLPLTSEEAPPIVWSSGTYYHSNDTIICIDEKDRSRLFYFTKQKNKLNAVNLKELLKNKSNMIEREFLYNDSIIKKTCLYKLLRDMPSFYVRTYSMLDNNRSIILDVYEWRNGAIIKIIHNNKIKSDKWKL